MSQRNAKLAQIHDLRGINSDATLTKKDLVWLLKGLRSLDKSEFTERDHREFTNLERYISHIIYN